MSEPDPPCVVEPLAEEGGDPACWAGTVEGSWVGEAEIPDLVTRTEVHDLVTGFYREVVFDELLGPYFEEIAEVDWNAHIPKLIDYWCWILFSDPGYGGAVTRVHRQLQELEPIGSDLCDRWFELWVRSVDRGWAGPYAERAKHHASLLMTGLARHVFGYPWEGT